MNVNGYPRPGFGPLPGASLDVNLLTRSATAFGKPVNLDAILSNPRTGLARSYGANRGALRVAQAGEPRYAYHPRAGTPRGLLIEPQGFNFFYNSNAFNTANWTKAGGATVTPGSGVGLDGQQTASLFSDSPTGTAVGQIVQTVASAGVLAWCGGVHVRQGPTQIKVFALTQNGATFTANRGVIFDLATGRVVSADTGAVGFIEPAPFGFFKCAVLVYSASADTAISFGLQRANAGDPQSAFEITEGFLENRTAPSSVMPTTNTVGQRAADAYTLPLDPSWVNGPEMTLYVEAEILGPDANGYLATLRDGTGPGVPANRIDILRSASGPQFVCETSSGGGIGALYGAAVPGIHRVAFAARAGAFVAAKTGGGGDYIDTGLGVLTSTTGTMPSGLSRLDLGHLGTNGVMSGFLRRVAIIPRALSAADLSDLLR